MGRDSNLLKEMRRRHVLRSAGLYIVGAWVVLQVADLGFESFGIPDGALRYVWLALAAGFPIALVFSWFYEVTGDGIHRTVAATGDEDLSLRGPDYLILAALGLLSVLAFYGAVTEIGRSSGAGSASWYAGDDDFTALAVLPLENLSGDESQEFLSAGLHDAMINTLARIARFRVTSRYSSLQVDARSPLADVRKLLGVDLVLAGSVLREGDLVRVNVSLADAESEQTVWADSFTREISGLIDVQNEIAAAIAREVRITLSPEQSLELQQSADVDARIYEAYLKGMIQLRKETPRGYRRAIDILTEAVEEAPTNALAYAGLAIAYAKLGHNPYPQKGASPRARDAALKALQFDPQLAEAHLAMGMVRAYYDWDFAGAEESYLRALSLNPSLLGGHYHYAWLLELQQRNDEALLHGRLAKELNPLSAFYSAWLAYQYLEAGETRLAIDEAEETLSLSPGYQPAVLVLGLAYADLGRLERALSIHEALIGNPFWGWGPALTFAAAGDDAQAESVGLQTAGETGNPFVLSLTYCSMDDSDRCLDALAEAKAERHPWFPWLVNWFRPLRILYGDPRMREYAAELGLRLGRGAEVSAGGG